MSEIILAEPADTGRVPRSPSFAELVEIGREQRRRERERAVESARLDALMDSYDWPRS